MQSLVFILLLGDVAALMNFVADENWLSTRGTRGRSHSHSVGLRL